MNQPLAIGYLANAVNCKFGKYNTLYDHVLLWDVELGDYACVGSNSKLIKTIIGKFTAISDNVTCGLGRHPTRSYVSIHPIFYPHRCNHK
jgi:hypothetical protein